MFIIRLCVYVTNSAGLDCYYKKGSLIKPTQSVYLQFVLPVKDSLLIWLPLLLTPLLSSMFQCLNLEIWWSVIKKKNKTQKNTQKKPDININFASSSNKSDEKVQIKCDKRTSWKSILEQGVSNLHYQLFLCSTQVFLLQLGD